MTASSDPRSDEGTLPLAEAMPIEEAMPPQEALPLQEAMITAADLCTGLAVPPGNGGESGDDNPRTSPWRHQSLSKGAAGVAILHAVRAQTGHGCEDSVRSWLARAVTEDLSAGPGAGLWFGAPAVAFAFAVSAPHLPARHTLEAAIDGLVRRRLAAAEDRLAAARRPALSEFDLVRGLTGLGAHLLAHRPDAEPTRRVLDYLVQLTLPIHAPDEAGAGVPGWWTSDAPSSAPSSGPRDQGGHADHGMAHGIAGPLALLALAMRRGITVTGHAEAIDRICDWLDSWRQSAPAGPWWPQQVTLADVRIGRPSQTGPGRPSWCYGTPGLARAQQLAGLARADTARQHDAEDALIRCLGDPTQLVRLRDRSLCHGWAGVTATTWYAAADTANPSLRRHLRHLLRTLTAHAGHAGPTEPPGLIDGRAGVALTLHTISHAVHSPWPACLLIA